MTTRTSREALRGKAQGVCGIRDPASLGPTLMHEHVLCDITPPKMAALNEPDYPITLQNVFSIMYGTRKHPTKYRLLDKALAIEELKRMREAGGKTVVDLTCGGLKPDPLGLAEISAAADVPIVIGCGYYVEEYQDPANQEKSVERFAQEIIAQVFEGAWGTQVRSGIIGEIGCQAQWTSLEKRVMCGAIAAQCETGAALNVHPGRNPDQPQEVMDLIRAEAGDASRTIISHLDRTIFDDERLFRLADTGCVMEFDLFGQETTYYWRSPEVHMPNDGMRLATLRKLADRGHLDRILISHDICYKTRLVEYGGHGYGHIFENVVPLMRRDFSEDEINAILVDNPRRLLTFV
jgi:phosphotriesterase-related protein